MGACERAGIGAVPAVRALIFGDVGLCRNWAFRHARRVIPGGVTRLKGSFPEPALPYLRKFVQP
jgi:hypothetical protein